LYSATYLYVFVLYRIHIAVAISSTIIRRIIVSLFFSTTYYSTSDASASMMRQVSRFTTFLSTRSSIFFI